MGWGSRYSNLKSVPSPSWLQLHSCNVLDLYSRGTGFESVPGFTSRGCNVSKKKFYAVFVKSAHCILYVTRTVHLRRMPLFVVYIRDDVCVLEDLSPYESLGLGPIVAPTS